MRCNENFSLIWKVRPKLRPWSIEATYIHLQNWVKAWNAIGKANSILLCPASIVLPSRAWDFTSRNCTTLIGQWLLDVECVVSDAAYCCCLWYAHMQILWAVRVIDKDRFDTLICINCHCHLLRRSPRVHSKHLCCCLGTQILTGHSTKVHFQDLKIFENTSITLEWPARN